MPSVCDGAEPHAHLWPRRCHLQHAGHRERFHPGDQIEVRDTALGRSVVLICEDLAQQRSASPNIGVMRPDWLFVPVLDGELLFGRWFHQDAWPIARGHGTNSIVATSLMLPLRENPNKARYIVGLCIAGEFDRAI
jgi:hypothetical protein